MAVATHAEGFSTVKELIPALVFHGVTAFIGMVCIGISLRVKKTA